MSQVNSIWIVILAACIAANLPFLSHRSFLGIGPVFSPYKKFPIRILELLILYFLVGCLALFFEKSAGQIFPQNWEFYAITGTLFVTLAFPGFSYRYLVRHRNVD